MATKNNRVVYTYRARLAHIEPDGELVTGDFGEAVTEEVTVRLSWPVRVAKRRDPRSADMMRTAARTAIRAANADMLTKREFLVEGIDLVSHRTFPVRER